MKVKELIALLAAHDPEMEVVVPLHHPETSGDLKYSTPWICEPEWIQDWDRELSGLVTIANPPEDDDPEDLEPPLNRRLALIIEREC